MNPDARLVSNFKSLRVKIESASTEPFQKGSVKAFVHSETADTSPVIVKG